MLKRLVWLVIAIIAAGGLYTWARGAVRLRGSDEGQVRSALLDAIAAINGGRVGEAMSVVSSDYKDSTGLNRDRLWILARRAADNREFWTVTVRRLSVQVSGAGASAEVLLQIHTDEATAAREYPLTVTMRKEDTHVWGIIPTQRWRVVGAIGLPDELDG